ncbi:MAG: dienelactone hydrolase family protein [Acidobacteria bacterium]|nr:dienelactone hydrolase family protein [Acidobacteriota bacterium]
MAEPFASAALDPPVRGFLHRPERPSGDGLVLTHGAGANGQSALLQAVAEAFAGAGFLVLRCDLPFRQARPYGPPHPGAAARDREGLRHAVTSLQRLAGGRIFLGGHSYGGRQATMLCAEDPAVAAGLLLLSYPLHPPAKPQQLRTQHFPQLRTPALFVHGTVDGFGAIAEMESALQLVPAPTRLLVVEKAGHDLGFKGKSRREALPGQILTAFQQMFSKGD